MKTTNSLMAFVITLAIGPLFGFSANHNSDLIEIEGDSCLVVLEESHFRILDSLAAGLNFLPENGMGEELWLQSDAESATLTDSLLEERLSLIPTTIPLTYNRIVKNCIELFVVKNRKHTARMKGMSSKYFSFFESELEKRNMPHELKYLAVIESAFNPHAVSKAGATGLWQLMFATGKWLGLRIDTYIDERKDPVRSTEVALDYLASLYKMYDDWLLAIAAYNSGPGNVNKAIRRSGGLKNFWAIKSYLPRETQSYVPLFIGASYALHYAEDHGIPSLHPDIPYLATDTIYVFKKRKLSYIAESIGTTEEMLARCNPSLKIKTVPKSLRGTVVNIPSHLITSYITNEARINNDSLYALHLGVDPTHIEKENEVDRTPEAFYYKVQSGDNLGFIAERYGVGVSQLKSWNNLRSSRIRAGQRLKIHASPRGVSSTGQKSNGESVSHKVKSGENLGIIANSYGVSIDLLKQINGLTSNTIYPGQVLKLSSTKEQVKKPATQHSTNAGQSYHVVKNGDTLWDIANAYGVSIDHLCQSNGISKRTTLRLGQKLSF